MRSDIEMYRYFMRGAAIWRRLWKLSLSNTWFMDAAEQKAEMERTYRRALFWKLQSMRGGESA